MVIELSKTLTLAPRPNAVLAANSPTVPAPNITTLEGGTPQILPNNRPFPLLLPLINSAAINTDAIPAISLKDLTIG